jgi:hemoglobin-like flavoprotein
LPIRYSTIWPWLAGGLKKTGYVEGENVTLKYRWAENSAVAILTPEQTELVRQSFDAIWPVRRKLADEFYRRFFELAPDAQSLFQSDMERQYLKLMDMIAAIVGTLDKREMFQSIISHSGRQHAQFGAKPLHFAALGDALIWGLEQQLGQLKGITPVHPKGCSPNLAIRRHAWRRRRLRPWLDRRRLANPCRLRRGG